ncbi:MULTISPECIES: ferritin-like domain-containing protein [Dickeya]|uniref:Ferritin n=1 Tax=Dickeya aquatica TaxID=1401087 RepID=A0A375A5M2_9GAMM|nr:MULTISPECIES: DUF2202 domain-containing protein [Dickeya]SLM61340.1 Putative ferritin [Dickeya aquatica]
MKSKLLTGLGLLLATLSFSALSAQSTLDRDAQTALRTALHDEYHAEAFYAAVTEKWGPVAPFKNIIQAEQNHAHMLAQLMQSYGIPVPPNTLSGSDRIKKSVPATLKQACAMAAKAEIANRDMYDKTLIALVSRHRDIVTVFQKLRDASQDNHLPAFKRCQ